MSNHILSQIDHSIESRTRIAKLITSDTEILLEILDILEAKTDDDYHKAAWALEYATRASPEISLDYITQLLQLATTETKDQAIRPYATIIERLTLAYYKEKKPKVLKTLNGEHLKLMASCCFDWLITDQKVAPKAYAIISLYHLGNTFNWIHPELKTYLEDNYNSESAAFKARARMVLKKL